MTVSFLDCSIAAFRELTSLSTCRRQLVKRGGQPGAVVSQAPAHQGTAAQLCSQPDMHQRLDKCSLPGFTQEYASQALPELSTEGSFAR